MQQILVILAIAIAVFFVGRRMWRALRQPKNLSCGCGCSGCDTVARCPESNPPFPMHKP